MTFQSDDRTASNWIATGAAIGLAGGLAEVLVVAGYSGVAGVDAAGVASAIATAVRIDAGSAVAGLAVHMALSAALGIVLLASARASGLLRDGSALRAHAMGVLVLGALWGLNFFVVLPIVSPGFVHLLPYPKLMFGLAAVATLRAMPASASSRWLVAPRSTRAAA
jgi:hypothetical protein